MHLLEVIVFYQVCTHISWFRSTKLGLLSCTGNQVHQSFQHNAVCHPIISYCLNLEYFLWFLSSSSQQFSLVRDKNLFLFISSKYLAQGLSHSKSTTMGAAVIVVIVVPATAAVVLLVVISILVYFLSGKRDGDKEATDRQLHPHSYRITQTIGS